MHLKVESQMEIQKDKFYGELVHKWDMKGRKELTLKIGDFNGHVEKKVDIFEGVHGGNGIGEQKLKDRMLLEFCNQKDLCMANIWFKKKEKRKVITVQVVMKLRLILFW